MSSLGVPIEAGEKIKKSHNCQFVYHSHAVVCGVFSLALLSRRAAKVLIWFEGEL